MAITTAQRDALIELYIAILDRAPDASGLSFWASILEAKGGDLNYVANEMWNSPGAKADYPSFLTVNETVARIYENVLNRAPDAGGLAFWVAEWNAKGPAATMLAMINNLKTNTSTDPQFLADKQLFLNKVDFGEWFAVTLASNDTDLAKLGNEAITSDPASITAAQTLVNLDPAETVILKAGTDLVETGNNDDVIKGTESTLNTSDEIDAGAGYDVLELDIDSDSADFVGAPTLDNIELITVTQGGSQGLYGSLDLSDGDFNDTITLEVNENEDLDWTWEDIQSVNNTLIRVIDTDEGVLNVDYDTNAYAGSDTADLTVAEVDCLTVNFWNETDDNDWSDVDQVDLHSLPNGQVNTTNTNYLFELNVGSSFKTLMIDGTANLTIERVLNDVNSVTKVDASGLNANLNFDIQGQGAVTGVVGTAGAARVAPLTIVGAQGNDDISVDTGSASGRNGVNGTYSTGTGNDSLKIGDFVNGFDGEDCHVANNDTLDCPENVWGDSTVSTGTGNDTVVISLHGEQNVDTADGNDIVTIMGNTDDILTTAVDDGISTISTGAGNDRVTTEGDYSNYVITLGDGADTLSMTDCEGEDCAVGDVNVSAGTGNDWMDIRVVDGYQTVDAGTGDDTLAIGCECDEDLGELSITMGDGNDDLYIYGISYNTGSDSDIDVDITLGAGDDYLSWQGATLSGTGSAAIKEINALAIDAGTGNDFLSFTGDHRFDLDMGSDAGNDTLELAADHLESQDSIDMGDGIDTIILHNGAGADLCDFGDGCGPAELVDISETGNTSSVEIFDLRNGNIELELHTGLFTTAEDHHITVRTELSERTQLPTITYTGNSGNAIQALSEGMTREDWESVVEDWQEGLYAESDGPFDTFDEAQEDLLDYILSQGVTAVDFDDINGEGLGDVLYTNNSVYADTVPGDIHDDGVESDDEDLVFFRVETCEQTVDLTAVDFSLVPGWEFTLEGGNVRDIIIADRSFVSGNYVLRFDSEGGDAESVTDTLIIVDGGKITDMDQEQITGLECIVLQSEGTGTDTWEIDLTEEFVSQTTGNAALEIFVDPNVSENSVLKLTTNNIGSPSNNVVVHINSNVTLWIDGSVRTAGYTNGVITVVNELIFTPEDDKLIGTSGDDTFIAQSTGDVDPGDVADGNGGIDTLLLEDGVSLNFDLLPDGKTLSELLDEPQISEIEIIKFVVPQAGLKASESDRTYEDISMQGVDIDGVQTLMTGYGEDTLLDMEDGIWYMTGDGEDFVELVWSGDDANFSISGGLGEDYVDGSNADDDIFVGGVEYIYADEGDDDVHFALSGDGDASGNDGSTYVDGASGEDYVELDDNGTNGFVQTYHVETVDGGNGNDTIYTYNTDGQSLYVYADDYYGTGNDYVQVDSYAGNVTVYGESGNDTIFIDVAEDDIYVDGDGGYYSDGADSIVVYAGGDSDLDETTILGGGGNDSIYFQSNGATDAADADFIDGEGGNDTIYVYSYDNATVEGGSGADSISVTTYDDALVSGEDDNDTIYVDQGASGAGNATVDGGNGNDTITVATDDSSEAATITGGQGDDSINLSGSIDGGEDRIVFGNITYTNLQVISTNTQTAETGGIDLPVASDGDVINNFNFELGGPGDEDLLDFTVFMGGTESAVLFSDWRGGAADIDVASATQVTVLAVNNGFLLTAAHIDDDNSGSFNGIQIANNSRGVVLAAYDSDGDNNFDKVDVYFVQDVDSDSGQAWAVDKVATISSITEIGSITSIDSSNFV